MTEEELVRFHNGDTLHNIPVVGWPPPARRSRSRTAALVISGAALVGAAIGLAAGVDTHERSDRDVSSASTRPAATTSAPMAGKEEPLCHAVTYKLPTGTRSCETAAELCALGAPWYTKHLERLCGTPPLAHVFVDNTDLVLKGECLRSSGGSWLNATVSTAGFDQPSAACSGHVLYTEWDTASALKVCEPSYPHTRITFLAEIQTLKGSVRGCISQVWGA